MDMTRGCLDLTHSIRRTKTRVDKSEAGTGTPIPMEISDSHITRLDLRDSMS
jgi:hypothetical protein